MEKVKITISLSKEDFRKLEWLCKKNFRNKSGEIATSISEKYSQEVKNDK